MHEPPHGVRMWPPSVSGSGDELVIEVTAERELDSATLGAARTALAFYGENAGIDVVDITETDADDIAVTFGSDVTSTDIDAFTRAISTPAAEGFYGVDAVHPATGEAQTSAAVRRLPRATRCGSARSPSRGTSSPATKR